MKHFVFQKTFTSYPRQVSNLSNYQNNSNNVKYNNLNRSTNLKLAYPQTIKNPNDKKNNSTENNTCSDQYKNNSSGKIQDSSGQSTPICIKLTKFNDRLGIAQTAKKFETKNNITTSMTRKKLSQKMSYISPSKSQEMSGLKDITKLFAVNNIKSKSRSNKVKQFAFVDNDNGNPSKSQYSSQKNIKSNSNININKECNNLRSSAKLIHPKRAKTFVNQRNCFSLTKDTTNKMKAQRDLFRAKNEIVIHKDDDIDTLTQIKNEIEKMIKLKLSNRIERNVQFSQTQTTSFNPLHSISSYKERKNPLMHSSGSLQYYNKEFNEQKNIKQANVDIKAHMNRNDSDLGIKSKTDKKKPSEANGCNFISIDKMEHLHLTNDGKSNNYQLNDDLEQYFKNNKNLRIFEDCIPETYESNITENKNFDLTNNDSIMDINKELNQLIDLQEKENINKYPVCNSKPPKTFEDKKENNIKVVQAKQINNNAALNKKTGQIGFNQRYTSTRIEKPLTNYSKTIEYFKNFLIEDNSQQKTPSITPKNRTNFKNRKGSLIIFNDNNNNSLIGNISFENEKRINCAQTPQAGLNKKILYKQFEKNQFLTIQSNDTVSNAQSPKRDLVALKIDKLLSQQRNLSIQRVKSKNGFSKTVVDPFISLDNRYFIKSLLQTDLNGNQNNSNVNKQMFEINSFNNKQGQEGNSNALFKNISRNNVTQVPSPITNEFIKKINKRTLNKNNWHNLENDPFFMKISRIKEDLPSSTNSLAFPGFSSNKKDKTKNDFYLNRVKEDIQYHPKQKHQLSNSISPKRNLSSINNNMPKMKKEYIRGSSNTFCKLMPPNDMDKSQNYVKNFFQKNKIMF